MKTGLIIQARGASTRLPHKVLLPLPYNSDTTVLEQVISRCKSAKTIDNIIVATTNSPGDEKIISISRKMDVAFFCGSEKDVLSRYYQAALKNKIDTIVRITSDCPCVDPQIIDKLVAIHQKNHNDYTTNIIERSYPHGLDVEVISFSALKKANHNASTAYEHEHVTPYIRETNQSIFKIENVTALKKHTAPELRITIDTNQDYLLLCTIFDYLYPTNHLFGTTQIIKLFEDKPWLKKINENVLQKKHYSNVKSEIKAAIKLLSLQEMSSAKKILENHLKKVVNI